MVSDPTPREDTMDATDQQEFVEQLAHIGEQALAPMPPGLAYKDTVPDRLNQLVFGLLVNLEGSGGIDPHRLSPKGRPTLDLAEQPLHDLWAGGSDGGDPRVRDLFDQAAKLVAQAQEGAESPREAVDRLTTGLCAMFEEHYEVVRLFCDGDGDVVEEGDDVTPGLVDAYRKASTARRG